MCSRWGKSARVIAPLIIALGGLVLTPTAHADVRTEARGHFRGGMALIQEGRLEEGVRELEIAYDLLPHPNVLYNIARAYAEAGQYEQAIEYYERYLDTDPPDREEVNLFVKALEQRLSQKQQAKVADDARPQAKPAAPPATAAASPEEIQALEDSATQIQTLAEATQSEALRQRADRLRELAQALRERERPAAPQPTTPVPSEPGEALPTAPTEQVAEQKPPQSLDLGSARGQDVYEEQVVSASRFAQSPLDAPNSTATITRQDIRLSGMTQIGEAMRRVTGADVMTMSPADVQVSMRGWNDRLNQRILVLVDGRSTYLDYLGVTFLSRLPFNVEDIERVEVIRGPASALYGANAFTGIVNIITRQPGEAETTAVAGIGSGGQAHAHLASGGRLQRKLAYRVAGGYNRADAFESPYDPRRSDTRKFVDDPNLSLENAHMNGSLRYRLAKNVQATVQGGIAKNYSVYGTRGPRDEFAGQGSTGHLMGLVESNWGQIRSFWNHASEDGQLIVAPVGTDTFRSLLISNVFDVDATLSRSFHLLVDHSFHLGGNYRQKRVSWNYLDADQKENHYAVYVQDTAIVTDWLTLVGSFRTDWHPLLEDPPMSPRGAVIVKPTQQQAIRLSAGTAFRTPTFVESYFKFQNSTAPGLFIETRGIANADQTILPEKIVTFELGYLNTESSIFKGEANAFYNRVNELIGSLPNAPTFNLGRFATDPIAGYNPTPNGVPLAVSGQLNLPGEYDQYGGELIGTFYPAQGVDLYSGYALNIIDGADRAYTDRTPKHKWNLGAQYRSPFNLDFGADLFVASKTNWVLRGPDFRTDLDFPVPAYYMINARVGYRMLGDQLELGLTGYNITFNRLQQHPFGQRLDGRVLGTLAIRL